MHCKVCAAATEDFGQLEILARYRAHYRRCVQCGFVFVDNPTWLEVAYQYPIALSDTGIVVRNLRLASLLATLFSTSLTQARRFLDFGGGAGLFVRLMRDRGFDFHLQDKYCQNLFAPAFALREGERFDVVTCLEVVEHLTDPLATFREMAALGQSIVIGTELLPAKRNRPGSWWYYAPETGQHIGFFTRAALEFIARTLGLQLSSNGRNLHVMSPQRLSEAWLRLISRRWACGACDVLLRPRQRSRSLTRADAAAAQAFSRNAETRS
jgi:hypothetical protein